ncbi:MAG: tannase/feruloyl esterase family alpha/beta hydrolase [Opitutaceae bacterium]|nr:tannase/feruloyl esterase family alpha/beta hydrolase [Opitutaceae bacterium]
MKTPLLFLALVSLAAAQAPRPLFADAAPVLAPDDLRKVAIPNTTIESVAIDPRDGAVRVTAIVTHPPAKDRVTVWVALPQKTWNGRFRGNGGGGFNGGNPESLRGPVALGFATAATDTGHVGGSGSFALHASGRLNWQEIRDNAYLGIHAMTVVGKALTTAFYGRAPGRSYFVGGSTGGRQGLMAAQRFPADYDGILSACPAINWSRMVPGTFWPQVAMTDARHFVSKAKLDAATAAAVAACDAADGVADGVIDDPERCTWDPQALVGTRVGEETFTAADADIVRKIWAGPRGQDGRFLWHGPSRGANLFALAGTEGEPLRGKAFGVGLDWFRYFLAQDAKWDPATITRAAYELWFNQSAELFGSVFDAAEANLAPFRDRGGKVIITHGLADQLIPHEGTVSYFESVQRTMGGAAKTAEFARLYLVPGVDHGFRGPGASPSQATLLAAIIAWVEEGRAPGRLIGESRDQAGKVVRTRPVFPYPQFAKYSGTGSPDEAASFIATSPAAR